MKTYKKTSLAILAVGALILIAALPACNKSATTGSPDATPTPTGAASPASPTASPLKVSPDQVRQAAKFATQTALTFGVSDSAQRVADAKLAFTAAGVLNGLSTGQSFTPADVQAKIAAFGGPSASPAYQLIGSGVSTVWATVYPQLPKDGKTAAAYLAALALGVQDGASAYLPVGTSANAYRNPSNVYAVLYLRSPWEPSDALPGCLFTL